MGCRPSRLRTVAGFVALLALSPALAASADGASSLVQRARASYRAGDHFGALDKARQALASYPDSPAALELNAQLMRDAQGPAPALPLFERAIKAAPNDIALLGEYAATLAEAGRNADMLRVARQMVELDPESPRAYFLQAVLAARAGRDDLARRLLWHIGEQHEPAPAALLLDGVLELRSGSSAQAVDRFANLARRQPDNMTAQLLLGRALLANGEANETMAQLSPLADRGDASPYLLVLVGRAYEELGRRADAAKYFDRAAAPSPLGVWALPVPDESELALWRAGSDPLNPAAAVLRLRQLAASGQLSEAQSLAVQLASRYPGSADVARVVGDVRLLSGDAAGALASYRRAATVRSDFALVQRMAAAEQALGSEQYELLAQRVVANPREGASLALLAQLEARHENWPRAAALLEQATAIDAGDPRMLAFLAQARLRLGDDAGALVAARRAHALQRGNGGVAWTLAQGLQASGAREAGAALVKAQHLAGPQPR